jgi:hypothetical protein
MRKGEREKGRKGKGDNRAVNIFSFGLFLFVFGIFVSACQPNAAILNSSANVPPPIPSNQTEKAIDSFEKDLETMRTANFDFIYVYRRKDGGKIDGEDSKFFRANSPFEVNRRILSDEEKAIIVGTNTKFTPEQIKKLQERFNVEDFSKPVADTAPQPAQNANANANANPDR